MVTQKLPIIHKRKTWSGLLRSKWLVAIASLCLMMGGIAIATPPPHYTEDQILNQWAASNFTCNTTGAVALTGFHTAEQILNIWAQSGFAINSTGGGTAGNVAAANVTGVLNTTQIGNGTAAAGAYVDGGTGNWTALPAPTLTQIKAAWTGSKDASHIVDGAGNARVLTTSDVPNLPASQITSGVLSTARLGSGSAVPGAYLDGTGAWVTLPSGTGTLSIGNLTAGTMVTDLAMGGRNITNAAIVNSTGLATLGNLSITGTGGAGHFLKQVSAGGTITSGTIASGDIPSHSAALITSGTLAAARGGTGADSSAATGIAHVASGTWTWSALTSTDVLAGWSGTKDSSHFLAGDGTMQTAGAATTLSLSNITAGTAAVDFAMGGKNITSAAIINATGRATLGNLTLSGQASTGIAHVDSGGNVTSSSLLAAEIPSTITPLIVTAASGNLLLKGGASAAGRLEIADRASIESAGTPGSYTDPGAGNIYLSGGVVLGASGAFLVANTADGSDTGTSIICGGGAASVNRGGQIQAFGNEHASFPGGVALKVGNVSGATCRLIDGSSQAQVTIGAGTLSLGAPSPATTATIGFPGIPVCAGTPTGTPTLVTGYVPMVYDSTGHKLWIYEGGTWKSATFSLLLIPGITTNVVAFAARSQAAQEA